MVTWQYLFLLHWWADRQCRGVTLEVCERVSCSRARDGPGCGGCSALQKSRSFSLGRLGDTNLTELHIPTTPIFRPVSPSLLPRQQTPAGIAQVPDASTSGQSTSVSHKSSFVPTDRKESLGSAGGGRLADIYPEQMSPIL